MLRSIKKKPSWVTFAAFQQRQVALWLWIIGRNGRPTAKCSLILQETTTSTCSYWRPAKHHNIWKTAWYIYIWLISSVFGDPNRFSVYSTTHFTNITKQAKARFKKQERRYSIMAGINPICGPSHSSLVGGFNPSEKYAHQIGSFPQGSGWTLKKWNHLSRHLHPLE